MTEQRITVNIKINAMRLLISRYNKVIGIILTLLLRKSIKVGFKKCTKLFEWSESNLDRWILGIRVKIPEGRATIEISHIFAAVPSAPTFGIFVDSKFGVKSLRKSSNPCTGRHRYIHTYINSTTKVARVWGGTTLRPVRNFP